jgi:hypothetical protein
LVEKIIARRCVMLGLHAPQTAVLQIVRMRRRRKPAPIRSSGRLML